MKNRLISMSLALLMLLSMLCACAGKKGGNETTTASDPSVSTTANDTATTTTVAQTDAGGNTVDGELDENGYLKDSLPADLNFGGQSVTFLAWDGQAYEEFDVESINGETVNDALYNRNRTAENRLGVKLEVVKTPGGSKDYEAYTTQVNGDIMSGSSEFDILSAYSRTTAMCAYQGLTRDLMQTKYFDVEKPWWPQTLVDETMFDGKLYFCTGDISRSFFHSLHVCFVNKTLANTHNISIDDLYQTVKDGKWTLDMMIEMGTGVYEDLDHDGKKSDGDQYGYAASNTQSQVLIWGADIIAIETDDNGKMAVSDSFTGERMVNVQEKLFGWFYNTNDAIYGSIGNKAFAEGRVLFFTNLADKAMVDFNVDGLLFGILPPPKYDEAQENYRSVQNNAFTLYAISNGKVDADLCSAVLECLASEGYRQLTPAIFETAMKVKYASDDTTSQMFDLIRANAVFDNGRIYSGVMNDIFTKTYNDAVKANDTAWMSTMESKKSEMEAKVAELNTVFAGLN